VKQDDAWRGLLLVGCSLAAAAPVTLAQTVPASVSACAAEADDARRLACYDREPCGDEHPKSLVAQKKRVTSHAGRVFLPDNYGGLGMQIRISY